jgi:hypothetical protein
MTATPSAWTTTTRPVSDSPSTRASKGRRPGRVAGHPGRGDGPEVAVDGRHRPLEPQVEVEGPVAEVVDAHDLARLAVGGEPHLHPEAAAGHGHRLRLLLGALLHGPAHATARRAGHGHPLVGLVDVGGVADVPVEEVVDPPVDQGLAGEPAADPQGDRQDDGERRAGATARRPPVHPTPRRAGADPRRRAPAAGPRPAAARPGAARRRGVTATPSADRSAAAVRRRPRRSLRRRWAPGRPRRRRRAPPGAASAAGTSRTTAWSCRAPRLVPAALLARCRSVRQTGSAGRPPLRAPSGWRRPARPSPAPPPGGARGGRRATAAARPTGRCTRR